MTAVDLIAIFTVTGIGGFLGTVAGHILWHRGKHYD